MKKRAIISVSNKSNLKELSQGLVESGYEILATGNTAKVIKEFGIQCTEISEVTNFPEIFSGRVKTLHPIIMGGILMRRDNPDDKKEADMNSILPIDVVCVNLYPFPEIVNREDLNHQTKIENIDIGGPSLIRAAAKNYKYVSVLTSPSQYTGFLEELKKSVISLDTRKNLAADAFNHTALYDNIIADYFDKESGRKHSSYRKNLPLQSELRYGENPHQRAFLYGEFYKYYEILHGKELSYNNIMDLTAAVDLINDLNDNSCVIVKHTNACGAACSDSPFNAYLEALSCDPVSAFGGIAAFNNTIETELAEKINEIFLEVICAPEFSVEALEILKKKKNRRLIKILELKDDNTYISRSIPGGILSQEKDNSSFDQIELSLVTKKNNSKEELNNLKFAWTICKHTKSNAIVFVKDMKAIGIGAGQMSRVDSTRIAAQKAIHHGHSLKGAVAASDAFFPFPDGVEEIASHGITSIIQPGGSVRDKEVIEAADNLKLSMIFTGIRNFKH